MGPYEQKISYIHIYQPDKYKKVTILETLFEQVLKNQVHTVDTYSVLYKNNTSIK